MQITEFNLHAGENSIASNAMPLCRYGTWYWNHWQTGELMSEDKNDCDGDYVGSTSNICGTMTEGGTYLMATDRSDVWKLGVCGLEYAGTDDFKMRASPICGAVPGGAMFCGGNECYIYSDATESWTKTANMNTYHTYGNLITKNGSIFVIGGSFNAPWSVEKYDAASDTWLANDMENNGVNREYKGFTLTDGPGDLFFSFQGFDCGNKTGGYCGYHEENYSYGINNPDNSGFFQSVPSSWLDIEAGPQMEVYENHMYNTFASRYNGHNDDFKVMAHTQRYMCGEQKQWDNPDSWEYIGAGPLLDLAQGLGSDISDISAAYKEQVDGPCKTRPKADSTRASFVEVEFYTSSEGYLWNGPYMAWSPTVDDGQNSGNVFAFFWDESNLKDKDTCYVNLCGAEHNPCEDNQECAWEWNKDTLTTSVTCDGEGKLYYFTNLNINSS